MRGSIETEYAGHLFRSRLEAKWAAFFDVHDLRWEYEPFDLNGWIPDFLLMGPEISIIADVKPIMHRHEFEERARELKPWIITDPAPLTSMCVILGATPLLPWSSPMGDPAAGLMSQDDGTDGWDGDIKWDLASWIICGECEHLGLVKLPGTPKIVPCGHHPRSGKWPEYHQLKWAWGMAHGATRWIGR